MEVIITTIAWDGTVIAADRQATFDCTPILYGKLHKITFRGEPAVVGCAGTIEHWMPILDWVKSGCPDEKPDLEDAKDFSVLIVTKSKHAFYAWESLFFHPLGKAKWAIGTGANYSLGAMAHGANAVEAVEIACQLDVNSGLGVDSITVGRL